MARTPVVVFALLAGIVLNSNFVGAGAASTYRIHLSNGSDIDVESYEDLGEEIAFSRSAGEVRVSKQPIKPEAEEPGGESLQPQAGPARPARFLI
jgi:hypothetical protein